MLTAAISEKGEITLPPEALAALNGAPCVAAVREPFGGVILRPAGAAGNESAALSGEGMFVLPPAALAAIRAWPAQTDAGCAEVIIENSGCVVLAPPEPPGTASMRKKLTERGVTETAAAAAVKTVRRKIYGEKLKTGRGAERKAG